MVNTPNPWPLVNPPQLDLLHEFNKPAQLSLNAKSDQQDPKNIQDAKNFGHALATYKTMEGLSDSLGVPKEWLARAKSTPGMDGPVV